MSTYAPSQAPIAYAAVPPPPSSYAPQPVVYQQVPVPMPVYQASEPRHHHHHHDGYYAESRATVSQQSLPATAVIREREYVTEREESRVEKHDERNIGASLLGAAAGGILSHKAGASKADQVGLAAGGAALANMLDNKIKEHREKSSRSRRSSVAITDSGVSGVYPSGTITNVQSSYTVLPTSRPASPERRHHHHHHHHRRHHHSGSRSKSRRGSEDVSSKGGKVLPVLAGVAAGSVIGSQMLGSRRSRSRTRRYSTSSSSSDDSHGHAATALGTAAGGVLAHKIAHRNGSPDSHHVKATVLGSALGGVVGHKVGRARSRSRARSVSRARSTRSARSVSRHYSSDDEHSHHRVRNALIGTAAAGYAAHKLGERRRSRSRHSVRAIEDKDDHGHGAELLGTAAGTILGRKLGGGAMETLGAAIGGALVGKMAKERRRKHKTRRHRSSSRGAVSVVSSRSRRSHGYSEGGGHIWRSDDSPSMREVLTGHRGRSRSRASSRRRGASVSSYASSSSGYWSD